MNGNWQQTLREDSRAAREAASRRAAAKAGRDGGVFLSLPEIVVRSLGWRRASHVARSLVIDIAQSGPNGKLTASMKYLRPLGWKGEGVVRRAVAELLDCGLLHEMRKGARPNKAAWYAITWTDLKHTDGADPAARATFKRGVYNEPTKPAAQPQTRRTAAATAALQMKTIAAKNGYTLTPSDGPIDGLRYAVGRRIERSIPPSDGAIDGKRASSIPPSDGSYLDIAICSRRKPAAMTLMGHMLRDSKSAVRSVAHAAARRRLNFPT